jgi:pimeloyl-ACP methyl ester carboxylesterase
MREFPIFVPHRGDQLAAVLTVPEGEPRGLVLLLTGIGAPRSHRFQMWARLARRLANHGLASARLDYHGMGDSSGTSLEWQDDWDRLLLPEVEVVARRSMEALGVHRVAAIGNCGGAELSLRLAASMPECEGAFCILLSVLEMGTVTQLHRRIRSSRAAAFVRRSRGLARVIARPLRGRRPERKMQSEMLELLDRAVERGRVLCLYGEKDREYNRRVHDALVRIGDSSNRGSDPRFELRVLPDVEIGGFESLALQDFTVDSAEGWLTSLFRVETSGITSPAPSHSEVATS